MSKLSDKVKNLLMPRKGQDPIGQPDYSTDARAVEQWAQQVGQFAGTIQEIVAGANVTVTNGDGPVVTIASTATIAAYASLTGPGQTTTPGNLTQAGGFTVNAGGSNIALNSSALITATAGGSGSITISYSGGASVVLASTGISVGDNAVETTWSTTQIKTVGPPNSGSNTMQEIFYSPGASTSRWLVGADGILNPIITADALGSLSPQLSFFGAATVAQQSSSGVTTVAQLVTILKNYGLLS